MVPSSRRREVWLCLKGGKHSVASLLAAATSLGADAAMLHALLAMALALVATEPACLRACLELGAKQWRLEGGLTGHDRSGRGANISAVQVKANTAHKRLYMPLAEASVCARNAGLGAVCAGADTLDQRAYIQ